MTPVAHSTDSSTGTIKFLLIQKIEIGEHFDHPAYKDGAILENNFVSLKLRAFTIKPWLVWISWIKCPYHNSVKTAGWPVDFLNTSWIICKAACKSKVSSRAYLQKLSEELVVGSLRGAALSSPLAQVSLVTLQRERRECDSLIDKLPQYAFR